MKCNLMRWLGAALSATVVTAGLGSQLIAGDIPADCTRACLENVMDQYLAAVVAHDPKRLPLAADVKFTENDQSMEVGDGFWATASGVGHYKHVFADPVSAQVAAMLTMNENGNLALMTARLRVQLGKITEIETTLFRRGGGGPNDIARMDQMGHAEALWFEPIPAEQRVSRNQLITTANMYFAGLENNDGKGVYPFAEDCNRTENGIDTTNNPNLGPKTGFNAMALGCKAQFESGEFAIVNRIHHRRYPLVDEERGVVWANCVFDMGGTVHEIHLTNGVTMDMKNFNRPSSIEVTEAFRIENGKIRRVEMIGSSAPYHLNPAWGGISGH